MRIEDNDDSEDEIQKIESENEDLKKMQKRQRQIIIIVIFLNVFLIGFCIFLFFWRVKNFNTNKSLVIEPKNNYSACILFLHGLNDNADHFNDLFEKINFKKKNSTKLIIMPVPKIDITNNNIEKVKEWYDANWINKNLSKLDNFKEGTKAIDIIKETINQEAKLLNGNYSKIIIGGYSQGAKLSLYTGNTLDHLLGGAISLCSNINENKNKNKLNAFLLHRKNDKIIPFSYQEKISNYEGVSKYYYPNVIHFANNSYTPLILRIANFLDKIL